MYKRWWKLIPHKKPKRTSQFNAKLLACPLACPFIILPSILLWFTSSKFPSATRLLGPPPFMTGGKLIRGAPRGVCISCTGGPLDINQIVLGREDSSPDHSRSLTGTVAWCHQRREIKDGRISPFLTAGRVIIHLCAEPYVVQSNICMCTRSYFSHKLEKVWSHVEGRTKAALGEKKNEINETEEKTQ